MRGKAARGLSIAGLAAAGLLAGAGAAHADIKIEERSSALESNVTRWTYIQGEKRSIVTRAETSGVLYNAGARYGAHVEIARPDQELIWELNPKERSYREVKFPQFSRLLQKGVQAPRDPNEQPLRSLYSSETTAIEVVPTGETRRIAGFQAERIIARAVVGVRNLISGNQFSFTFDQEVWLTKDERILREIEPFETAYVETFGSAISLQQAQVMASEWNDAFITHIRAMNDRIRALKGFPLASTTTVTEESIAQNKGEKGTKRKLNVASHEVKRISLETLPGTEFELPVGYINEDTKIAVAPKAPPAGAVAAAVPPAMPSFPAPVAKTDPPSAPEKPAATVAAKNDPPAAPVKAPPVESEKPAPPVKNDPPVVVRTEPEMPEKPVMPAAAEMPRRVAAAPAGNPGPTADPPAIVTPPPTNVVVSGGPAVVTPPAAGSRRRKGKKGPEPVIVTGYSQPAITNNYPVLTLGGLSRTQNVPPPVVIDEPLALRKKKRR